MYAIRRCLGCNKAYKDTPGFMQIGKRRVHNRVLRSRLPAHFPMLIPPSCPSLRRNPDPALIFSKVILIKIKTYLYTMGSKYGAITIRKHAFVMFLNTQSRFLSFALNVIFAPLIMGLMQISRSRFKPSKNSMLKTCKFFW